MQLVLFNEKQSGQVQHGHGKAKQVGEPGAGRVAVNQSLSDEAWGAAIVDVVGVVSGTLDYAEELIPRVLVTEEPHHLRVQVDLQQLGEYDGTDGDTQGAAAGSEQIRDGSCCGLVLVGHGRDECEQCRGDEYRRAKAGNGQQGELLPARDGGRDKHDPENSDHQDDSAKDEQVEVPAGLPHVDARAQRAHHGGEEVEDVPVADLVGVEVEHGREVDRQVVEDDELADAGEEVGQGGAQHGRVFEEPDGQDRVADTVLDLDEQGQRGQERN